MRSTGVSVIVAHYGDPEHALGLVEQLLAQRDLDAMEVIVVDDASPIPFPKHDDPHVEVLRRTTNGGFGSAVNDGAFRATQPWLLILNSDVRLEQDTVRRLLDATPDGVMAGPAVRTAGIIEPTGRVFPTPGRVALARVQLLQRFHRSPWYLRAVGVDLAATPGRTTSVDWFAGVAMLMPVEAFHAVGGFDSSYFMYCEEIDLQRRLADYGVPRMVVGTIEVEHLGGASSDPGRTRSWLTTSQLHYAQKWGGHGTTRSAMRLVALINLATSTLRRAAGRPIHPLSEWRSDLQDISG